MRNHSLSDTLTIVKVKTTLESIQVYRRLSKESLLQAIVGDRGHAFLSIQRIPVASYSFDMSLSVMSKPELNYVQV